MPERTLYQVEVHSDGSCTIRLVDRDRSWGTMLLFWTKKRLHQELLGYGYEEEVINDALDRIEAEKEITIH